MGGSPLPTALFRPLAFSQQVYYWEADSPNDTEKMKVLFLPETVVKLKNLTSHTQYLVSISAFNAAGDGPRSDPRPGRTHQAGRTNSRLSHEAPMLRGGTCGEAPMSGPGSQGPPGQASARSRRRKPVRAEPASLPSPQGLQAADLGLAHNHQGTFQVLQGLPVRLAN